jgi:hypothetical protein
MRQHVSPLSSSNTGGHYTGKFLLALFSDHWLRLELNPAHSEYQNNMLNPRICEPQVSQIWHLLQAGQFGSKK